MAEIVALRTSFRRRSNSTALLEAAAGAAREEGSSVEVVDVAAKKIGPCRGCDACRKDGRCIWKDDDLCALVDRLWEADRVLVAMPVYYMAVPAQLKLLVDRTQCLYNRKYVLKDILPDESLACRVFEGVDLTMRFFFDSLQMQWAEKLYVQHVDRPGEIEGHPKLIEQAREMGRRLAAE